MKESILYPNKKNKRTFFKFTGLLILAFLVFFIFSVKAEDKDEEDEAEQKEKIEEELEEIEEDLEKKKEKEITLSSEIEKIESNITQSKKAINETTQQINQFQKKINNKKEKIDLMEKEISVHKRSLAESLREYQRNSNEISLIFLNSRNNVGEYFILLEQVEQLQDKFEEMILQIKDYKKIINDEKDQLENNKELEHKALMVQEEQKRSLELQEDSKQFYLDKTKDKIGVLEVKKQDLRRQLNALQSLGKAISLEDAIEEAEYSSKKTGVRLEFLLGVLRVESNMGQNVGGGTYKKDMNPNQHDTFKDICDDLGYKAKKMPVSKRVCYNTDAKDGCGGWGGAMGPAQFMPSTWMGYKDRVAKITGDDPADPWNLRDSLVAMGLKLAAVSGVTKHKESAEKKAAAMYLAGGAWESYSWYGDRVLNYADMFEEYLDD